MRKDVALFLLSMISIVLYFYGQLTGNYLLSFTSIILYTISISITISIKDINIFVIQTVLFGFTLWAVYYIIWGPNLIMANSDLMYMNKVTEEAVVSGHYPFNDQALLVARPNYVQYPVPFMLQAILSVITSINATTLMYIPIVMYLIFILIVVIVSLLIKYLPEDLFPLSIIPAISFITPYPLYFIYSDLSRALLLLITYVLFIKSREIKPHYTVSILAVTLSISAILGHVQEPITFGLFYIIYLLSLLIVTISQKNIVRYPNYIKQIIIFILLFFSYNIYVSIITFNGVLNLFRSMLSKLLLESSIKTAATKASIAQSVLTEEEFITMLIGFIIMLSYVLIQLLKYTVRSFKIKDNETLAFGISIFLYGIIALIPFLMPGIDLSLYWRSLWSLFVMISIWTAMIIGKQNHSRYGENNHIYMYNNIKIFRKIIVLIVLILYILAVNIYLRVQLISSSVYTHEASTVNMLIDSSLIKYLKISDINTNNITIIDTPDQPAYEIAEALLYLNPNTSPCSVMMNSGVKYYINIKYSNGLLKIRQLNDNATCTNFNILNSTIIISLNNIQLYKSLISRNVIFSLNNIAVLK